MRGQVLADYLDLGVVFLQLGVEHSLEAFLARTGRDAGPADVLLLRHHLGRYVVVVRLGAELVVQLGTLAAHFVHLGQDSANL